jgi:predicted RNA-binding protein with PIN domain
MSLLIDGYNLMHAAGMLGRRRGPGVLEKARLALLNVLAESLDPADVPRTTVVFDAKQAPRGVPRMLVHRGIGVRFAAEQEEADELIEELIRTDSAPRRLTVVSSDHRLQTAARRRRATAVDSEPWFDALLQARRQRREALPQPPSQGENTLREGDVEYWLAQFGPPVLDEADRLAKALNEDRPLPRTPPPRAHRSKRKR